MRGIFFAEALVAASAVLGTAPGMPLLAHAEQAATHQPNQSGDPDQANGQAAGQRRGMRGGGMGGDFPAGARGILGSVTEVTAEHYKVKTDSGETYTVHYSSNTRIMKQPPGGGRRFGANGGHGNRGSAKGAEEGEGSAEGLQMQQPQPLKPNEIKVGDFVTAGGEMDTSAKSIGAIFIMQLDPERAKQMREMQANYGKTWLAGRITAIDGTRITIEGMVDHAPHAIEVDEDTSFRQRRDAITLADIKPGQQLRAEGAVKEGVFRATTVVAMNPQNRDQNEGQPSATPKSN